MNARSPSSRRTPAYLVVGCKPWNRRVFAEQLVQLPGRWSYVGERAALTPTFVARLKPRFIFFLHWSWKVPAEIIDRHECVCFHMTDVPYGRGGSPLQNLIVRGHHNTKLTALRMTEAFDAGPVYLKRPLSLAGTAEEILMRASALSAEMIKVLIARPPVPRAQSGRVTTFRRRTPAESAIPAVSSLDALHDFVRMLDADGYPRAFLDHHGFRYEFSRAVRYDGRLVADVTITSLSAPPP
ncbi:MAG TPA: hypothetical protein VIM71_11260 [Lacunisphaera sp.]